jgi:hypothetical protein
MWCEGPAGRRAAMLDRPWLSPCGRRSSSGGTSHPRSFFVPFAGTCATPFSYRDVQELLVERGLKMTIRRSGDGFNAMHRNSRSEPDRI